MTSEAKNKPILIYIAGPYRAPTVFAIEQNIHRAREAGAQVLAAAKSLGVLALPVIPHANTAHFDGLASDELFLEGTLELMRRCDGVLMLDRWHTSEGARGERAEAKALGMPVWAYHHEDAAKVLISECLAANRDVEPLSVSPSYTAGAGTDEKLETLAEEVANLAQACSGRFEAMDRNAEELGSKVDGHREMCTEEIAEARVRLREDIEEGDAVIRGEMDAMRRDALSQSSALDDRLAMETNLRRANDDGIRAELEALKRRVLMLEARAAGK